MGALEDRDVLQRFVFERARVRGELVRLDATWQEVIRRREYPPALRAALGELMAASALLAATIKFDGGAMILQIQGGTPVGLLVVECQSDLTLRATAMWDGELARLEPAPPLRALAAGGRCVITIDPGKGRHAYQSIVPLEGPDTGDVLERYMARSEQLETRFCLAADDRRAMGLLLQKLPPKAGAAGAADARDDDGELWERAQGVVAGVTPAELLQRPPAEILRSLFRGESLRVFETMEVRFACRCSRRRVGGVIRMIGADETRAILAERGDVTITCEFCRETYVFGPDQAEAELRDATAETPPRA